MTIEEKVGQLIQADIGSIKPEDLATYPLGSILAGGNSSPERRRAVRPQAWLDLSRAFRAAAAARPGAPVPLMFGIDAVHGHNNIVGATIFPHNIGLGAARDPDLIRRIARRHGAGGRRDRRRLDLRPDARRAARRPLGPDLRRLLPRDPTSPRSYAGALVHGPAGRACATARALAPGHVAGSAKHFLADGGTTDGKDQGDAGGREQELIDIHLAGYRAAIDAGVLSVMASFSSWNGVKHTGNRSLLTDVLRGPLGFDGLVDRRLERPRPAARLLAPTAAPPRSTPGSTCSWRPTAGRPLYANTLAQARSGEISAARLDEAVARILRAKVAAGVFDPRRPDRGPVRGHRLGRPPRPGPPGRAPVAGPAEERERRPAHPRRRARAGRGRAPPTTSARRPAAGPSAGRAPATPTPTSPTGQSIWAGIDDAVAEAGGSATLQPRRRLHATSPTSPSSSSARRPMPSSRATWTRSTSPRPARWRPCAA